MPSINDVIKEIQNWLRLAILIHCGLKEALLAILHNDDNDPTYTGLPRDPADLYTSLNTTHLQTLTQLLNPQRRNQRKVLTQKQWNILFPPNKQETNTDEFDVTLIVILIINCAKIPQPVTGWNPNSLAANDNSKAANVLRARELRNYISHTHHKKINAVEFTKKWKEGEDIVKGLGSNFDTNSLKIIPLDPTTSTLKLSLIKSLDDFCKQEVKHNAKQIDIITKFVNDQNLQIKQIDATLAAHSDQLNQQGATVAGHSDQLNQQGAAVAGLSDQLNQQGAAVAGLSDQLNQQNATVVGLAKKVDEFQKPSLSTEENLTEESVQATDPRVEVFTHFGNGCVLKFQLSTTDIIEKVMYKSVEEDCHWSKIQRKTTEDVETVCYQENITKENLVMLKVENLKETTKHWICVQTSWDQYNALVTIYDKDECGHVICVDKYFIVSAPPSGRLEDKNCCKGGFKDKDEYDPVILANKHFIVLAPPSGRLEDENCCKNGINGMFVEKEMILNVPISQGPIDGKMKVSEFTDFSNLYRNRNFPATDDVIKFPPFSCIKDPDVERTAELFSKFLSTRKGLRAVVWNADSNKYHRRVFQSKFPLQMERTFDNRIMVYDDSTASILNIRVIQQSDNMLNEMENIIKDLKSFVTSHRYSNPTFYCLGMLCFPNANRCEVESQMNFYFAQHDNQCADIFYICKEDLESLKKWWENVFEKELERLESAYQCQRYHLQQDNNSFSDVLSECLATIAMANTSTTPTLTEDTHLQIKTLLLNADQIEAIEHPSKRKLILGNYGSGKSIVADEIFKQIYKQHRFERRKLLNIVWEKYSLLEVYKHNLLQEIESTYPGSSDEFDVSIGTPNKLNEGKDVSLLKFLTKELKGNKVVDIIIDELPSEAIHESEVKALKDLLDDYPDSSVIFIPQSVIIDRNKNNDDGKSINIGRNCLRKIGLEEFSLSKTMRNSKQICAVLKCLQQQHMDSVLTIYKERIDQATTHRVDRKSIPQKIRTIWKSITRKKKAISSEASTSEAKKEITESRFTENAVDAQTKHLNPYFDKVAKHLHDDESKDSEKSTKVLSSYRFFETKVGNQINDHKPILVNLPSIFDLKKTVSGKILAITLKEVCKLSPQTLIICNILEEIKLVSFSLSLLPEYLHEIYMPYLQGYIPTVKEKRSLMDKFSVKKRIILLDNTGAKGIESRNVIIFIEKHEHFLRHEFVETLARANISCYVIMYTSPDSTQHEENTMGSIIAMLVDNDLVEQTKVTSEKDHTNFEKSHRFHGNDLIVNDVYCEDQMKISFDTFLEKFNENHPILSEELNYRDDLENLTKAPLINHIVHEVEHDGHTYTFDDVWMMLERKDFGSFESIVDVNPNIINNLRDEVDSTLLMYTIAYNRVDICEYLTSKFTEQIDYIAKDDDGWTVFHDAASYNNINAMNILIAKDRRGLEICDVRGRTPLFYAARKNRKSMVILLLENGADAHVKDHDDRTADRQIDYYGGRDVIVNEDIQRIIRGYQTKNASTGTS